MRDLLDRLRGGLRGSVLGAEEACELLLVALLGRGHALVTGAPGLGKTSLARRLAGAVGGEFRRVQFTPDVLPADILGYHLYRQDRGEFEFIRGPVFSHILLADEINRSSPRTQAALLEAMNERQVTIDGETHALPEPFFVVATQNDTSSAGTFPLPEAQLDRFLVSIPMSLPDEEVQLEILRLHAAGGEPGEAGSLLEMADLQRLQAAVTQVTVGANLQGYLLALCQEVRRLSGHEHSVSVRACLAVQRAAQAAAVLEGAEDVLPDHVQFVFPHVLRHRLLSEEIPDPEALLQAALAGVPVP
ncbi:MAG: AAA family ATPase [Verrucomicrobiales bacterium]